MQYLGGISGEGALMQHGKGLGRGCYDFDGFFTLHTGVTCNGEFRCGACQAKTNSSWFSIYCSRV